MELELSTEKQTTLSALSLTVNLKLEGAKEAENL